MTAVLFRLVLLAGGMAAVEIGLGSALVEGSIGGWAVALLVGLPLIVAGSAGFMSPLLDGAREKGTPSDV
jgi:hypothetical protein